MKKKLLGDLLTPPKRPTVKPLLKPFETKAFAALSDRERGEKVNQALLSWIQKQKEPCFLLPDVLEFISQVGKQKILSHYTFPHFELWLNQFSKLSAADNYRVRAKIVGKWIERNDYQNLFPIGMGKQYEGTHFVTAHRSPDLDTTIASFWGWVDAFAARVGDGLHLWNLPGGPPSSQIEIEWLFRDHLGESVFTHLAKTHNSLHVTGQDLVSQKGFTQKGLSESVALIDHECDESSIVVVDGQGGYLGDWRSFDVEGVRQVTSLLSSCLRWFENALHLQLISLLAKADLNYREIPTLVHQFFDMALSDCEPAREFTFKQRSHLNDFLIHVLKAPEGSQVTFTQLSGILARLVDLPFHKIGDLTEKMRPLFNAKGELLEKRPAIFRFLEKTISGLHQAIFQVRERLEKLDVALKTKHSVFGRHPHYVTFASEVEEIREKMDSRPSLTVLAQDQKGQYPLGVISASFLRKATLGTVSLRDFCNRDEMGIPSYLEVISVIDHHKSLLTTFSPPLAIIADAQSSNSLVARAAFEINDRYSLGGLTLPQIDKQLAQKNPLRVQQRLLQRRLAQENSRSFFIDPQREILEYLHFLYAILDDTDLLSKVSSIDLDCIASLLNRLKSLLLGKEVEIVSLDDLPRDASFPKKGAQRILQNEDMYSLYRKVYEFREKEVARNILSANIFADTKEQNGCCRVGQTKVFASNIPLFHKKADSIRRTWLEKAEQLHAQNKEIDLHLHMISTIVGAEEVYQGKEKQHTHKDEMWIWVANNESGLGRLRRFLSAFQSSPGLKDNPFEIEFLGKSSLHLAQIFKESFLEIPHTVSKHGPDVVILYFKVGSLNSRKAMVSPYLPTRT